MKSILVIDDCIENLTLIEGLLSEQDIDIVYFDDAMLAYMVHQVHDPFDLSIIDFDMPIMGGLMLSKKFRDIGIDKPIIIWTGEPERLPKDELHLVTEVLSKNIGLGILLKKILNYIGDSDNGK